MSGRPFYRNTDVDAIRKISDDNIPQNENEGFVTSINAGGIATVQVSGSSSSLDCETMRGINVKNGDHVFLRRSKLVNRWFIYAVGVTQLIQGAVSGGGISPATPLLTAPNAQFVIGGYQSLIYLWTPSGIRSDLVYQVEVADDNAGTGAIQYLVAGSVFIITVPANITKYFRIRSVDKDWNTSGWTSYSSGKSLGVNIEEVEVFSKRILGAPNNNPESATDIIKFQSFNKRVKETSELVFGIFSRISLKINGFLGSFTHSNTANRTYTLPDNSGTIALKTDQPDILQIEVFN